MKPLFASVLAALSFALPASASTWTEINQLATLVKDTGTQILEIKCKDGRAGSYEYNQELSIDRITICTDTVNMEDPDAVWEVLVHEATHVMQACNGDHVIKLEYHPRVLREIKAHAPHYYGLITTYTDAHKLRETEAFWMELQSPNVPLKWFVDYCYTD